MEFVPRSDTSFPLSVRSRIIRAFKGYPPWSAATAILIDIPLRLLANYRINGAISKCGLTVAILAGSDPGGFSLRIPICLSLIVAVSCQAQQVSGPKSDLVQSGGLKIVVVQGEGAENNLRTRNATQPVVEIRDD